MKAKLLITLAALFSGIAAAQIPDCNPPSFFIGVSSSVPLPQGYDNRSNGCQTWTVFYVADAPGFTLSFQSSLGENAPAGYTAYTGTMVSSSASFGTAMQGVATFTSLSATPGSSVDTPWVQVNVTGLTGTVRIGFYGYRTGPTGGTGGGGGGGGGTGCPNPCPVEGVDAAGAAPIVPPVATAGFDGTDNRRILTDTSGDQAVFQIGLGLFLSGQQAVTGTAAALPASAVANVNVSCPGCTSAIIPPSPAGIYVYNGSQNAGHNVYTMGGTWFLWNDGTQWNFSYLVGNYNDAWVLTNTATIPPNSAAWTPIMGASGVLTTSSGTLVQTKSACVKALIANTINVYVGGPGVTTSTGFELPPGQGVCTNVNNTDLLYVVASTTGASVSFEWTN